MSESLAKKGDRLYKCRTCGTKAHINKKQKRIIIYHTLPQAPKSINLFKTPKTVHFPLHLDCELGKPIDKINLDKLIRVEVTKK